VPNSRSPGTQFDTYIPQSLAELEHHPDLLDRADLLPHNGTQERIAPILTSRAAFESAFADGRTVAARSG
jgi:hypothetical protein